LIEQSRHLLPHGGRTTLYAGTKTNTAPSGGDVKKVTSGARCSANVGLWHRADIQLRPQWSAPLGPDKLRLVS
jgi:hypothetical protein